MFSRIPFDKVNWLISSFLMGTLFLSITAVPAYLWFFGIDSFQIALFFVMFFASGFSITLGYHRLFSHLTFQAHWIVRSVYVDLRRLGVRKLGAPLGLRTPQSPQVCRSRR